jgi:hypothetical protein
VVPDERPPDLSEELRARLESHYREDARRLAELGVPAPWIATWDEARGD